VEKTEMSHFFFFKFSFKKILLREREKERDQTSKPNKKLCELHLLRARHPIQDTQEPDFISSINALAGRRRLKGKGRKWRNLEG
jgi:hypothetical protein